MKAVNAVPPRRDLRHVQAGWALILLSGLIALGIASASSAVGLGEAPSLTVGLILGGVVLLAGEVWIAMGGRPSVGARRTYGQEAAKAPIPASPVENQPTVDMVVVRRAVIYVSPPSGRLDSPLKGDTRILHERLDGVIQA